MTDITVYMEAGRALRTGEDLYKVRNVRNWPYLYPPLPALIFVPLSHLTRGQASYAWFVISLGCVAGSVLLTRATLRQIDVREAQRACGLGLLPVALPLLHTLQRGQINALPLLCVCLAIYAVARRRDTLAGIALAGAAAIKITPGFAVVYFVYRWLEGQVAALRSGTWQLKSLLRGTKPLAGYGLGLVLGLWLIPALYMGPRHAATTLASWRSTAGTGYFQPDAAGNLFGDIPGIRESSSKNQSWYRAAFSTIGLLDPSALAGQELLQARWQQRMKWILAGIGIAMTAGLLWLSRGNGSLRDTPGPCATLAALAWLGISLGKIAWGHFYVIAYPLMAVACLTARKQDGPDGRALGWMLILATAACVAHYGLASQMPLSDIGGMLLPMTVLALATVALANRRGRAVDCGGGSGTDGPDETARAGKQPFVPGSAPRHRSAARRHDDIHAFFLCRSSLPGTTESRSADLWMQRTFSDDCRPRHLERRNNGQMPTLQDTDYVVYGVRQSP